MNGLVRVNCRFCSKPRDPREFRLSHVDGICWSCAEWLQTQLDVLAGDMPRGCVICERTLEQIAALQPGENVRMLLHPVDGRFAPVCPPCSDLYETKRRDLYANTPYGFAKGLDIKT